MKTLRSSRIWLAVGLLVAATGTCPLHAGNEPADSSPDRGALFSYGDSSRWAVGLVDGGAAAPEVAAEPPLAPTPESREPATGGESAKAKALTAAAAAAYKPLFYDNKFDYLCDPAYCDWHLGENAKRLGVGDWITIDAGGQYRARLMDERNHRGLGLTGSDDDFLLHRTRLYLNTEVGRRFRFYAEYIDADSNYEEFVPRPIEVNRSDLLNLFGDVMLLDSEAGPLWARVGRQELLYGAQRIVSPLDWADTRRTFDGYKMFWKGGEWSVDAFYTRPVYPDAERFDAPDQDQEFMGFWGTYRGCVQRTLDLFYLVYNNGDAGFAYDTLGGRWTAAEGNWLLELEGAVQFGQNADNSDHSAGFWVAGLGHKYPDLPWQPTLWAYYDWASGSNDLGAGNGYHHLFPLAHKYLGFMDLYGRRNIESPNLQLTLKPHEKVQLRVWYYYFFLQNTNDTPYSVVMTPYNPGNAPASADLGHEVDFTVTYQLTPRAQLLFGYSHFVAGDYYKLTPGVPYRDDADFFYTQFQVNF